MAVQRVFNSTTPFKELRGNLKVGYPFSGEEVSIKGEEYEKETLLNVIPPSLRVLLTRGTAKQLGAEEKGKGELSCSSIVAQAECEGAQEFSPTITEHTYFRSHWGNNERGHGVVYNSMAWLTSLLGERAAPTCTLALHPPRKRRKRQRRRRRREEGDEEEQEQETSSGVPEQESSCSVRQMDTQECLASSYRCGTFQSSGVQETEGPGLAEEQITQPHCAPDPLTLLPCEAHPWAVASISPCSVDSGSDSLLSSVGECEIALKALRNTVSQEDRCFLFPFFRKIELEAAGQDYNCDSTHVNEGLLFHPEEKLKPKNYEFREGREFTLLSHIQSGSYGDVYSVQDNGTGFKCAAKKIPMNKFNSEEVGSWSALISPRVVELFGAVRDGPNVILFMDLKPGSLGQLLRQRGRLPEDLALHYHRQVLEALEHLHKRRVLHLDVKVENVLLSEDGRDTFLCDFSHSERLGPDGMSTKADHREARGTETHMSPEVVRGECCCAKADVWSSCCMLLHMLNGCPPWTRYYSHPLCLKIVNEPPPLREIPPTCNEFTIDIFNAGLQKEPVRRASVTELLVKLNKALYEVGGLQSSIVGAYQEPVGVEGSPSTTSRSPPSVLASSSSTCNSTSNFTSSVETSSEQVLEWVSPWRETAREEDSEYEEDDDQLLDGDGKWESSECPSVELGHRLPANQCRDQRGENSDSSFTVSEQELQKLSRDLILGSLSQPHPPELQEQMLSCLSSDCYSHRDPGDKDSGQWSVSVHEDLSSGVFSSYSSQIDGQSFSVDWLGSANWPSTRCFEGVDVWIENFDGQCLRIRESPKVSVGHIATGISKQILKKTFSLETIDGQTVCHSQTVPSTGLWLRCIQAPSANHSWSWRVRDGVLETRE